MTRTRRVAGSVALSFTSQLVAMVVGLWLTRFILDRLGQTSYGVWLIILQALGYLALADIGVVALLPRQTAFVTGRDAAPGALAELVGRATRLVLWQWPVVMLLCAVAWLAVPVTGTSRDVLGLVLLLFAVAFPLRLFTAVLQGLQDLVFLGSLQFAAWALSTVVTVVGLLAGLGLFALALSWGVLILVPPLVAWTRLRTRFPDARPRGPSRLTWPEARGYLASSLWVSLGQVSGLLVSGADVLIIGFIMGPAVVVPYVVTLKLITVIGNFPVALAHASGPALSQMRAGESREDLRRATGALAQAVLAGSGAVACVIMAVNEGFVGWWVGADRYAGTAVTVLALVFMLAGHYGATVVYTVYSFGHEKLLALSGLLQGAAAAVLSIVLVKALGPVGAPLGGLIAVIACALPIVMPTLAAETGTSVPRLVLALVPFVVRVALALAAARVLAIVIAPRSFAAVAATALLAAALYAALILPVALRPPLREYVLQLARLLRDRLGWSAPPAGPAPPAPPISAVA